MLVLGEEDSELVVKLWAHAQEMWEGTTGHCPRTEDISPHLERKERDIL
jgi:hypothetical protein